MHLGDGIVHRAYACEGLLGLDLRQPDCPPSRISERISHSQFEQQILQTSLYVVEWPRAIQAMSKREYCKRQRMVNNLDVALGNNLEKLVKVVLF